MRVRVQLGKARVMFDFDRMLGNRGVMMSVMWRLAPESKSGIALTTASGEYRVVAK